MGTRTGLALAVVALLCGTASASDGWETCYRVGLSEDSWETPNDNVGVLKLRGGGDDPLHAIFYTTEEPGGYFIEFDGYGETVYEETILAFGYFSAGTSEVLFPIFLTPNSRIAAEEMLENTISITHVWPFEWGAEPPQTDDGRGWVFLWPWDSGGANGTPQVTLGQPDPDMSVIGLPLVVDEDTPRPNDMGPFAHILGNWISDDGLILWFVPAGS